MGTLVILEQVSLRDSEAESGWVFLAFSPCLRIMSQRWPCHNSRKLSVAQCTAEMEKRWGGAPRGLTIVLMSSVTSQGLCSRYITCNFQFWSSLLKWMSHHKSWLTCQFFIHNYFFYDEFQESSGHQEVFSAPHITPGALPFRFHL